MEKGNVVSSPNWSLQHICPNFSCILMAQRQFMCLHILKP